LQAALPPTMPALSTRVKAGYLYNFTKFVMWPEMTGATFNLCLLGSDPFGKVIDAIEKKSAFGKAIQVIRLDVAHFMANTRPETACYILYISATDKQKSIIEKLRFRPANQGTLVVGEGEKFASDGGMIGFVNRDGKIKLQINQASAKQSGLKISAKLLEIAELIRGESHD
jgi:hypothetical protein